MTNFIHGLILFLIVLYFLNKMFKYSVGDANIVFQTYNKSNWKLDKLTDNSVELSTVVHITNEGKQCGTIMDCFVRPLLPYEQFDGIRIYAKAELSTAPRRDDYFEALILQKKGTQDDSADIIIKVNLVNNKDKNIKETLQDMVDVPLDIVYQHAARYPWRMDKETVILPADEIAKLLNIKLNK